MLESLGLVAASTYAKDIDFLFDLIFWITGFWLLLAEALLFYLIVRFRKKPGVPGQYISGERKHEKRWITIPHFAVLLCDVVILFFALKVWYHVKQELPQAPDQQIVRVIGQQWAWTFVHAGPDGKLDTPDDITKVNELHVQVDKLHHFQLESKDVIHSFSVPVFRLKQDVVPGRVITGWFTPIKTGSFDIQCTKLCGIGHALMPGRIVIETSEQHAAWISQNSTLAVASATAR